MEKYKERAENKRSLVRKEIYKEFSMKFWLKSGILSVKIFWEISIINTIYFYLLESPFEWTCSEVLRNQVEQVHYLTYQSLNLKEY